MFRIYGIAPDVVDHIMDRLPILRRYDEQRFGGYRTKLLILERYYALTAADAAEWGKESRSTRRPGTHAQYTPKRTPSKRERMIGSPYLEELRLTVFKWFRDAVLPLRELTLLIGRNGSGKSNAIDALHVLGRLAEGEDLREAVDGAWREGFEVRGGITGAPLTGGGPSLLAARSSWATIESSSMSRCGSSRTCRS